MGQFLENRRRRSRNRQRVAQHLLEHWERALYESRTTVAQTLEAGRSTVVWTAVRMGCRGFPELQTAFRMLLEDRVGCNICGLPLPR